MALRVLRHGTAVGLRGCSVGLGLRRWWWWRRSLWLHLWWYGGLHWRWRRGRRRGLGCWHDTGLICDRGPTTEAEFVLGAQRIATIAARGGGAWGFRAAALTERHSLGKC
jgi:hypothetical protein